MQLCELTSHIPVSPPSSNPKTGTWGINIKQQRDLELTSAPAFAAASMTPSSSAAGIGPVVGAATFGYFAGVAVCSDATALMGRALPDLEPSTGRRRVRDGGEFLAPSLGRREEEVEVGARRYRAIGAWRKGLMPSWFQRVSFLYEAMSSVLL